MNEREESKTNIVYMTNICVYELLALNQKGSGCFVIGKGFSKTVLIYNISERSR